jgi:hypothetical protein
MPATYTHWAYAGAIRLDASNALISTYVRGSWVYYVSPTEVLSAGAATVPTAIALAAALPPNALSGLARLYLGATGTVASNYANLE